MNRGTSNMPKFNTFETQVDEILGEATGDVLNAVKDAMKRMTPGSNLFEGPGNITNKYDIKKNYYPNVRSGFAGLINKSLDKSKQAVIDRINQLRTYDVWDPNKELPNELKGKVSTQYSQDFIVNEEKYLADAQKNLEEAYKRMPRDNQSEKLFNQLLKTDTSGMTKNQQDQHRLKTSKARDDIEALIQLRDYMNQMQYSTLSMLQKAHVNTYITQFNQAFDRWFKITRAMGALSNVQGSNNQQVDEASEAIPGTFLKKDGTIYRDKWEDFLNNVQTAVVGASQSAYVTGINVQGILTGVGVGKWQRRGDVSLTGIKTLDPNVMKNFHEKIMIPLFMSGKNNVLIYATPEQWESVSQGGRLYKAATGTGKEAWTAGQRIPKVRL